MTEPARSEVRAEDGAGAPKRRPAVRAAVVITAGLLLAFGAYAGFRTWKGYQRLAELNKDVLPEFTDPPPGPPPPSTKGIAFEVGKTPVEQLTATLSSWGLVCRDTSVRALMQQAREAKVREIEEAKARGEDVDGITGASLVGYRSKKEQNPQVRLSCDPARSDQLKDRGRTSSSGRVLAVYDSPGHPLRHISYRRMHKNHPAALDDLTESLAFYTTLYGPPHETAVLPDESDAGVVVFKKLQHHKFAWRWPTLLVRVSAMNMGERGVDVLEAVEVPWPVRSDWATGVGDPAPIARKPAPGDDQGGT